MKGKLFLVATPIGNLEDITLRAIKVLKDVDIIVAEDTRQTLKLLNHFEIKKSLISYHRHSNEDKKMQIIDKLVSGYNIALVSDAGTPAISDPGEDIVRLAIEENIEVIPIPGACAFIMGLIASGIDTKEFTFLGFLPMNKKIRKEKLYEIKNADKTIILYEAPHKLIGTLSDLDKVILKRKVVLARELTKVHEEFIFGTAEELIEKVKEPRGEFVIIIEKNNQKKEKPFDDMTIYEHYSYYEKLGYDKKEIVKKIAKDRGVNKNEIYQKFINNNKYI